MSCVHIDSCLPVTSIYALELANQRFVLQGSGPELLLLDYVTGHVLARTRAFRRNNIHGIQAALLNRDCTRQNAVQDNAALLVWGGASLCIAYLNARHNVSLSILSPEVVVTDWISNAAVMEKPDLHPVLKTRTVRAALATAHNVLMGIEIHFTLGKESLVEESRITVSELASGLNSMLYSADLTWLSTKQILVAAGTVFGEIVVWSCLLMDSASLQCSSTVIHHLFTGHDGSIFGVNISSEFHIPGSSNPARLLCSCSDDRTLRVWNITDCYMQDAPSLSSHLVIQGHSTGFGRLYRTDITTRPESCVASVFGHASRIWSVRFLDVILLHDGMLSYNIVSRGEDATTQIWNLRSSISPPSALSEGATLKHVARHHYHSGKNVWSLAVRPNPDSLDIFSGAADGSVVNYAIKRQEPSDLQELSPDDEPHDDAPLYTSSRKPKPEVRIVKYAFVSETSILAISSRSEILLGTIDSKGEWDDTHVSWECLEVLETYQHNAVVASDPSSGLAILSDYRGGMIIYNHTTRCLKEVAHTGSRIGSIYMLPSESSSLSFVSTDLYSKEAHLCTFPDIHDLRVQGKIALELPTRDFLITSAHYDGDKSWLILGGRTGGLAIFQIGPSETGSVSSPIHHFERVHGKSCVTSISQRRQAVRGPNNGQIILTTGRDSYFCIHEITEAKLLTIHKTASPFAQFLEGACFDDESGDLIFFGFQSTKFLVWNDTAQRYILEALCGGAHRSWAYYHPVSMRRRKTFCWTRVSTFNLASQLGLKQRPIRAGTHGREIRTTDVSRLDLDGIEQTVIATGSEDDAIRLFYRDSFYFDKNNGSLKSQLILKKHTTGLQHLQWTMCGGYLFSSGALEEFYVWRVRMLSGFGICAVCEAECPKSSPSTDLRITQFDIVETERDLSGNPSFMLCLCYSNSEVKVFSYTPNDAGGTYVLLAQGRYTTNCLTKVKFLLSENDIHVLTAATDGNIAIWSLSFMSPLISIDAGKLKWTCTAEHLTKLQNSTPHIITPEITHSCHQSSIKALSLNCYNPERGQSIMITGGDDNAINIMRLTIKRETPEGPAISKVQNVRKLASAHVSSVNAIRILRSSRYTDGDNHWVFMSCSNDQRVKIWRLDMMSRTPEFGEAEDQKLSLLENMYTPVADVADIARINGDTIRTDALLLVSGVGMDLWRYNLPQI